MDPKMSESPVKRRLPLAFEKRLSPQPESKRRGPTNAESQNGSIRQINLNQMSAKIKNVESRLKNRDIHSSKELFSSTNIEGLKFRKDRNGDDLKSSTNIAKVLQLSKDDLRSSWEDGNNFGFWLEEKGEDRENQNKVNCGGEAGRLSFDVGVSPPDFGKGSVRLKLSQLNKRMEIPRIEGLKQEAAKPLVHNLKGGTIYQSQEIDMFPEHIKAKNHPPEKQNDTIKNRIKRSMELIEMIKSQENKKGAKEPKEVPSPTRRRIKRKDTFQYNGFQVVGDLGKGKFGEVFLARHVDTGFLVALKKITKQKLIEYKMVDQFIKELKLHSAFDHPKIVKFYGVFEERDSFYIVMEYMNGGTLFEHQNLVRVLNIKEAVDYLKDIIEAVSELHDRSIVHRDIKPENIVLTNTGVAKLCDFGWASVVDKSRNTYCGTLQYASPQILEKKAYDMSVDIWSIGILTYQMLMGRAPFEDRDRSVVKEMILNSGNVPLKYSESVPAEARNFIGWLMQRQPQKRPRIRDLLGHQIFAKYASKATKKI